MASPSEIKALISANLYSAKIVKPLEAYVASQVSSGAYDFAANRHLLKLYKMFPKSANPSVAAQVLVKALMQMPDTDLTACLYLVPSTVRASAEVQEVLRIAGLLESFDVSGFWKAVAADKGGLGLSKVKGFAEAAESFVVSVVAATYSEVPVETLAGLLREGAKGLDGLVEQRGWTWSEGRKTIKISDPASTATKKATPKFSVQQFSKVFNFIRNA